MRRAKQREGRGEGLHDACARRVADADGVAAFQQVRLEKDLQRTGRLPSGLFDTHMSEVGLIMLGSVLTDAAREL